MITHPTLYDIDKCKNTRVWWVEQEGGQYRVCSGIENGAIVRADWTTTTPTNVGKKSERNPVQQADFEINALYTKKIKSGYSLNRETAGAPPYIEPMLAVTFLKGGVRRWPDQWIVQKKYNGHRCIAKRDGLFSRRGEKILTCPHIEEALKPFFDLHPNAFLDGEIYNYELRQKLNELSSLIRKTKKITTEDFEKSRQYCQYHIYDGDGWNDRGRFYVNKKKQIDAFVDSLNSPYIFKVKDYDSATDDIEAIYAQLISEGEEGIMYRHKESSYVHGRCQQLVKRKEMDDAEFIILDIREGTGNWSGKAKIISVTDPTGKFPDFDATFKGSMEEAIECLNNKDRWIGKTVTIQYFGLTGLGTPSYAQFDYNNCIGGKK